MTDTLGVPTSRPSFRSGLRFGPQVASRVGDDWAS